MKKIALSIVLLCLLSVAQGGNPVMLIRCSNNGLFPSTTAGMSSPPLNKPCFLGTLKFEFNQIDCNNPNLATQQLTLTIKKADDSSFGTNEVIPLSRLLNCIIIDKEPGVVSQLEAPDPTTEKTVDDAAIETNGANEVTIDFTRNPFLRTKLEFFGQSFEIPACPMASDPCSCSRNNIVDANGNVLFWEDQLTYSGNPDSMIILQTNTNPDGFLDHSTQAPVADGTVLGTTNASGILVYNFYKKHGEDTDIVLREGTGATVPVVESCPLAANACIERIPTLSEWALIILSLLLLTVSTVAHRFIRVASR